MRPYIVAAVFGAGTPECELCSNAVIAASREVATANFIATALQESSIKQPLSGIVVVELEREFLERALHALGVGQTPSVSVRGQVVELRPQPGADIVPPERAGGDGEPA